jgi:histidinol-phosphate aminotransferase
MIRNALSTLSFVPDAHCQQRRKILVSASTLPDGRWTIVNRGAVMQFSRRSFFRRSFATTTAINGTPDFVLGWLGLSPPTASPVSASCVYLDRTESACEPSERLRAAMESSLALRVNRYPREHYDALRSQIAALHSLEPKNILLGCGSSEILEMAAMTLAPHAGTKKSLIQALPTCPVIAKYARAVGANVIDVPLTKTYGHDLGRMLSRAANEQRGGIVYICNPNNPTGTLTDRIDIQNFVAKLPRTFLILIDEAYCHFVSPHKAYSSFLDKPLDDPRVVICRTFSKVYGLAGMRIGYAAGHPETLKLLGATQLLYGVGTLSAAAALEALRDTDYVLAAIARNADIRQEFMNQTGIRMLRALNSHASFVMLDPLRPADRVLDHLKSHNVFVSPVVPPMDKYIRVSLGTSDDLREFWRVIDLLPPPGRMAM